MSNVVRSPKIVVTCTPEIIKNSTRRDSGHCMIADAIASCLPETKKIQPKHISVDLQTIRFTDPSKRVRYTYLTPRAAQVALVKFDEGTLEAKPFSFKLSRAQVTSVRTRDRDAEKRQRAKRTAKEKTIGKARLIQEGEKVPRRVGGQPPPVPSYSRRREFGLRAFTR
jgi:hypothetical protein